LCGEKLSEGRSLRIELERDVEVCVWVPCHITCFFEIREHDNPLETGSRGAGFNLDVGIRTIVRLRRSRDVEVSGGNDVSRDVVERMLRGLDVRARAELEHDEPVPMGVGYGGQRCHGLGGRDGHFRRPGQRHDPVASGGRGTRRRGGAHDRPWATS